MNNILAFLETKVAPFGEKVGNQRHLKAIRGCNCWNTA